MNGPTAQPAPTVLVVGGTGVFGRKLVRGILRHSGLGVVIAGRRMGPAEDFARACLTDHPGRDVGAVSLDAATVDAAALQATGAFVVVDAAGPWQGAAPHLAAQAIAAGLHYLDLADARDFVARFPALLDGPARQAGVVALTGVSSTPALSNAVLDCLVAGWRAVDAVEIAIAPGNRAPRGLSVVRAILSYAGRPVRVFLDGAWVTRPGWGLTTRRRLAPGGARWLSLAETPDLDIVPARLNVRRSVLFRAGLELHVLHLGLLALSLPVRLGWPRSLAPAASALRTVATALAWLGSDRGFMLVRACGIDAAGAPVEACWTLTAEAADGPVIPTLPALACLRALAAGRLPGGPGARACAGVLRLDEVATEFLPYRIRHAVQVRTGPAGPPLLAAALGAEAFARLPEPLRQLHTGPSWRVARGLAQVEGPEGWLAALAGRAIGFPRAGTAVPVRVVMAPSPDGGEVWTRWFDGRRFSSTLHRADRIGLIEERFGPLRFTLGISGGARGLTLTVAGWRFLGIRLPRLLAPVSHATEDLDEQGRFRFDVTIALPFRLGRVIRYRGWLAAERD